MDMRDGQGGEIVLDIRRKGRAWVGDEFYQRLSWLGEVKLEFTGGKMFWSEEQRLRMLALLLENVGMDATIRHLGGLKPWREAIAAAELERGSPPDVSTRPGPIADGAVSPQAPSADPPHATGIIEPPTPDVTGGGAPQRSSADPPRATGIIEPPTPGAADPDAR